MTSGDGGWSGWFLSVNCSVECGNGTKTWVRNCTNPLPLGNGKQCLLDMKIFNVTLYGMTEKKEEPCNAGTCSVGEKHQSTCFYPYPVEFPLLAFSFVYFSF